MRDQDAWCTLEEYQKINAFAKGSSLRYIQRLAEKGLLPVEAKKIFDPNRNRLIYYVKLTDQNEILRLKIWHANKATKAKPTKAPLKKLNIVVIEGSPEDWFLQSRKATKYFKSYLENKRRNAISPEEAPSPSFNRYTPTLSALAYECVALHAKIEGKSMADSYIELFYQFAQTDEGKAAIFVATNSD